MKDDSVLIQRTLDGDMQAFRWLITRHQGLVAHVVRRVISDKMAAEEICQDVFMKVYDKLDTFKGEAKFTTWLVTIAYRTSLNAAKRKTVHTESIDEKFDLATEEVRSALEKNEIREGLELAIEKLPDKYREVITLFHLEEMSYQDVADITGMPVGTVKNYLFRGRKALNELLHNYKYELMS
jgi:RNA polymerase sigma-70 factor (ECF subfamily)